MLKTFLKRSFCAVKENKPQLLQQIHRQLYARMHNLDYLQWLERNSARYTAGICIMALLISTTVLWPNYARFESEDSQPAVHSANLYEEDVNEKNTVQQPIGTDKMTNSVMPHEMVAEIQLEKEKVQYLNPLHISGYQAPCSGILVYNYGLGFDPMYEDYRYHRELCYGKGDGAVYACIDGKVQDVKLNQHWQLAIQSDKGTIWYSGMQDCYKTKGETVIAGERIGSAEKFVYVQALKTE